MLQSDDTTLSGKNQPKATHSNDLTPERAARMLADAGISYVPMHINGSKAPSLETWKEFQTKHPTPDEAEGWFGGGKKRGVGAVCGKISANLEVVDLDEPGIRLEFEQLVEEAAPGLLARLVIVATPKGGRHYAYRCAEIAGSHKLAQRMDRIPDDSLLRTGAGDIDVKAMKKDGARLINGAWSKVVTRIETKGEGGLVMVPGSPAECHPLNRPYAFQQGSYAAPPEITPQERDVLLTAAASFNTYTPTVRDTPRGPRNAQGGDDTRPGGRFNRDASIESIGAMLEDEGWTHVGNSEVAQLWRRPGKTTGNSASLFFDSLLFYVFSTSAFPFDAEEDYDAFGIFTRLKHDGDFTAATKALAAAGYGEQPKAKPATTPDQTEQQQTNAPDADWRTSFHLAEQDPADLKHLIDVSLSDHEAKELAWKAIEHHNRPARVFQYGLDIVTLQTVEDRPVVVPVNVDSMREIMGHWMKWQKREMDGRAGWRWKDRNCRVDVVRSVLNSQVKPLPILKQIVHVPTFSADGHLNDSPGYSEKTGLYYSPARNFIARPLPERVSTADLREARRIIEDVLIDFPFVNDADRHNAIGLFLTPFVRQMIAGPTPNHLISASTPGSGKGLLTHVLLSPAIGNNFGILTAPKGEDDWRKQLTAALLSGRPAIQIDNLLGPLDSGVLAAALTAEIWDDRILGSSKLAFIPVRSIFVTTANNPQVSTEIARRCVEIRITPDTDAPEERTNFRHPDLKEYVDETRADLVWAAHILTRHWLEAGRPAFTGRLLGSFENYSRVVGGILQAAGYDQFLQNFAIFKDRVDLEREARAAFCHHWFTKAEKGSNDRSATSYVTGSDVLFGYAHAIDGIPIADGTQRAQQISFGRWLNGSLDMIIRYTDEEAKPAETYTFTIEKATRKEGKQHYKITRVKYRS